MLTEEDKNRCRHHLGYLAVQASQTFVLGVPAGVQTQFMVEGAFNRVLPSAEAGFRRLLDKLDRVEERIEESTEDVEVESVGNIKINDKALQRLLARYQYWRAAVANMLGVIPNPYDQRFGSLLAGGINVPVVG